MTETATWIASKLINIKAFTETDVITIDSKVRTQKHVVEKFDRSFRSGKVVLPEEVMLPLENAATTLWNTISVSRRIDSPQFLKKTLLNCKCFSASLLALHEAITDELQSKLRAYSCFVKTLKYANEENLLEDVSVLQNYCDKSFQILEKQMANNKCASKSIIAEYERLRVDMFIMNMEQALRLEDLELAKFYESKAAVEEKSEFLKAETIMEIGRMIYNAVLKLSQNGFESKKDLIYILERGNKIMHLPVDFLPIQQEFCEMKFTVMLFLTNMVIENNDDDEICLKSLTCLQNEYHKKVETYKVYLKFLHRDSSTKAGKIEDILMQMIMSVDTIMNFDSILACINQEGKKNTEASLRCLDYLFYNRLVPDRDHELLEKILATHVFIVSQSSLMNNEEKIDNLENAFFSVEKSLTKKLSKTCVSGIITLLFNSGKKLYKCGKQRESTKWFGLALTHILSGNTIETGKVQRALQISLIELGEFDSAEKVFDDMSSEDKKNSLTLLNMFRVFSHRKDDESVKNCLNKMKDVNDSKALDILIVAISECERSSSLAIHGMLCLFEKLETTEKSVGESRRGSIICSLRYTAQMILKMSENEGIASLTLYVPTLHKLFEKGLDFLKTIRILNQLSTKVDKTPEYDEVISVEDIEWFSSTCYNLTRKLVHAEEFQHVPDLVNICASYIDLVPMNEISPEKKTYYQYWKIRTLMLRLFMIRKCSEWNKLLDEVERALKNFENYQFTTGEQDPDLAPSLNISEILETRNELIGLFLESALNMKDFKKVKFIVDKSEKISDLELDKLMVNILLSIDSAPLDLSSSLLFPLIERNIGDSFLSDDTLCHWLSALLEVALPKLEQDCLNLLTKFQKRANFAQKIVAGKEIEYLATKVWNYGVSCIIKGQKTRGTIWCKLSLSLSALAPTNSLEAQLKDYWVALTSSADLPLAATEE